MYNTFIIIYNKLQYFIMIYNNLQCCPGTGGYMPLLPRALTFSTPGCDGPGEASASVTSY